MSYFRTVTFEISATCATEAEVEWFIHGPDVEPPVRILHIGEATDERPDHPDADRLKRLEREFAEVMAEPIPRQLHGRGVELANQLAALRKRMCPHDNPACPAPTAPAGEGRHAACVEAEADRWATEQRARLEKLRARGIGREGE